jgi:twinkle protein
MAEFVRHESCPGCGSRDNLARYSDGSGWCFGCKRYEKGDGVVEPQEGEREPKSFVPLVGEFEPLDKRHITAETCRQFGYRVGFYQDQPVQIADYYDAKGRRVAQKVRFANKDMRVVGNLREAGLFGQQRASAEMGHKVYVTEGEVDALSLSQVLGNKWPVVSIKNGASGARKDLEAQLDWLDTFRTVVLCFDADEAGESAAIECAELIPHKVRIARLPMKDANEMLVAGQVAELIEAVNSAAPYRPDGIREAIELVDAILVKPEMGLSYPWESVNKLTHGIRRQELVTVAAGTGVGKSAFTREIVRHLRAVHGERVGVIALEESARHSALAQVSLELNAPLHIPEHRARFTDEQIREAAQRVLPGIFLYDHFGSLDANSILPKIRYLAHAHGVRHVVLDHLSIMVSGYATDGDERKRIDEIVTKLRSLVQELDIGVHLVSHLRRTNGVPFERGGQIDLADLRGSSAIAGVSDLVIGLERDQQDEKYANVTTVRVCKNRFSGENGITGYLAYRPDTGRLVETEAPKRDGDAPASNASVDPVTGKELREF